MVGTSIATLTYHDPASNDVPDAQVMAAVCVSYSAEHLAQRSNERFFAVLQSAGATILDLDRLDDELAKDAKAVNARALPWQGATGETTEALELWPWIAAAAALLLVADVAVRRVRVPWDKIFKRRAAPVKPAQVLARGPAKAAPRGAFDPSAAPPPAASAPPALKPAAESSSPSAPTAPGEAGGLLGAKKRAQQKQKWEENP
jgi:hypothetical protein